MTHHSHPAPVTAMTNSCRRARSEAESRSIYPSPVGRLGLPGPGVVDQREGILRDTHVNPFTKTYYFTIRIDHRADVVNHWYSGRIAADLTWLKLVRTSVVDAGEGIAEVVG